MCHFVDALPTLSNPNPLDFADAEVIVAPVVKPRRFRIQEPGHALRNFDTPAVSTVSSQVVGPAGANDGTQRIEMARNEGLCI
jgi:hypothetical protein